ncbi:indole-3-glycerol phosphate synthase TrpC [Hydrocarboniphaga sp.]|uniref:indole-3-glycerol phosphate synthase TrpC n=1 Tax=Hydrocarboniphaga sp. TaxID=2033016 RepID=UPI002AB909EE|nr:indole-3-glycerol phosphate synthase TrpC [Hydrocarboniphaga sp.]MDZ4077430.1 indole-3-glycerol phosphate synthase TrpC [Hydrocarboniphaga sp.]
MSAQHHDILDTILARKREEIAALRERTTLAELQRRAAAQDAPRGFAGALQAKARTGAAVIAEIKRASPSKGLIRADFDAAWLAQEYEAGGAACLSVLTDRDFFQGGDEYLIAARAACSLPVIRKDFIIDEWQVVEARAIGADCILLIAAALSASRLRELHHCALEQELDVLVEIHDGAELDLVLSADLGSDYLLGINNRNLRSFETSLDTTLGLLARLPAATEVVTESGIGAPADVQRMLSAGVRRFLVGESLMRQPRPSEALRALIG